MMSIVNISFSEICILPRDTVFGKGRKTKNDIFIYIDNDKRKKYLYEYIVIKKIRFMVRYKIQNVVFESQHRRTSPHI